MKRDTHHHHRTGYRTGYQVVAYWLTALLLFGCGQAPEKPAPPAQAPDPRFALRTPAQLGDTPLRLQRLTVSHQQQKRTLLAQWQVQTDRLSLEVLTSLGLPLLSLTYTDHEPIKTKTYIPIPEGLSARRIITDLQWAYWPIPALNEGLQPGYDIRDQQRTCTQGSHCRQLWYQDRLISEVDYLDARATHLVIIDHQYDYQLNITTLTESP